MSERVELVSKGGLARSGSLCSQDPQDGLLKAFTDRDLASFTSLLSQADPNHWYGEPWLGTLLDAAARTPGTHSFVAALLQAGADPNLVNKMRKKTPLHQAVESCDQRLVDAFLAHPTTDLNSLDATGGTVLHTAVRRRDEPCLRYLLQRPEINLNIPNRKGQTPLLLALSEKFKGAVVAMIDKEGVDLDFSKNVAGKTAREMVETVFPELVGKLPPKEDKLGVNNFHSNNLFNVLRTHDSEKFIAAIKEKKHSVESSDGMHTLLQYCCEFGLEPAAAELLALGANPNASLPANSRTPLMLAAQRGFISIVRLLVNQEFTQYLPVEGETALHSVVKGAAESLGLSDSRADHLKCLHALLEVPRSKLDLNQPDNKGNTALHLAAKQGDEPMVLALLRAGAYIGHSNLSGQPPLADMNPGLLEAFLDECLGTNGKLLREDSFQIVLRYRFLVPPAGEPGETQPLLYMSRSPELRHLLKHPLMTSFLHLKWYRIRKYFYVNLAFYFFFWVFLTTYILAIFGGGGARSGQEAVRGNSTSQTGGPSPDAPSTLWVLVALFLSLLVLREFFQLVVSPLSYLLNPENWLEAGIIGVTLAVLLCGGCTPRHQLSAVAILLSWAELVLLIGRHPALSTNIEMLKTVSWNFLKFLAWYSILIVAFALSFYTLFRDAPQAEDNFFEDPGSSVFKTVVMLTGEFDAASIPFVQHPGTSHVLFVLFVFLIAIVLFNLLNGLAVSDTAAIKSDAELFGYISRVKFISYVEAMAVDRLNRSLCLPASLRPSSFSEQIDLFPSLAPDFEVRVFPNLGNRVELSREQAKQLSSDPGEAECVQRCKAIFMEERSVRAARAVLRARDLKPSAEDKDQLLVEFSNQLKQYKQILETINLNSEKTNLLLKKIQEALLDS